MTLPLWAIVALAALAGFALGAAMMITREIFSLKREMVVARREQARLDRDRTRLQAKMAGVEKADLYPEIVT